MNEQEAVALLVLACALLYYAAVATRDVPTIVGGVERLPKTLRSVPENVTWPWKRPASRRTAVESYLVGTAFSQFVPTAFLWSYGLTTIVGIVSALEIAVAAVWTVSLLFMVFTNQSGSPTP